MPKTRIRLLILVGPSNSRGAKAHSVNRARRKPASGGETAAARPEPFARSRAVIRFGEREAAMRSPVGPDEIRVVIQPVEARDYDLGPIPAQLFKKTFDGFFTALETTDRELQPKAKSSEFVISHLALNSCEFGIMEKRKSFGHNSRFGHRVFPAMRRRHLPKRLPDGRSPSAADEGVYSNRQGGRSPLSRPGAIQRHGIADRRVL